VERLGVDVAATVAAATVELKGARERSARAGPARGIHPRAQAGAHAVAVHAQAQVHARHPRIDVQRRREDAQATADHLQLAEPLERGERVAPGLRLARQAAYLPGTVGLPLDGQVEAA